MDPQESYYEYWGLTRPPFDNVPDPAMYFDMHASVDSAVGETLFAIEEGNECLVVIVGDVGFGKTMTLRVILDSLEQDRYRIALVTNPDMTFIQLLAEIVGQLNGEPCPASKRGKILELFNQTLFQAQEEGKKVLIFIDEANAMKSENLESLRLLTNMQGDDENLFTIVMAGQLELAQRLEHPKHANLFQRIGVYCRLHKIESPDLMRDYLDHRLERAGTTRRIFTEGAYEAIWESSEQGIPRLVNRMAKLALKAGQVCRMEQVDAAIVRQIGSRFSRMAAEVAPESRKRTRDAVPPVKERIFPAAIREEGVPAGSFPSVEPKREAPQEIPAPAPAAAEATPRRATKAEIIKFPDHIYTKAKKLPTEQRLNFAGQLAAEVLKKYPHLVERLGTGNDPVPAWITLRNVVMQQMRQRLAGE